MSDATTPVGVPMTPEEIEYQNKKNADAAIRQQQLQQEQDAENARRQEESARLRQEEIKKQFYNKILYASLFVLYVAILLATIFGSGLMRKSGLAILFIVYTGIGLHALKTITIKNLKVMLTNPMMLFNPMVLAYNPVIFISLLSFIFATGSSIFTGYKLFREFKGAP
jgi:cation transport ATPase